MSSMSSHREWYTFQIYQSWMLGSQYLCPVIVSLEVWRSKSQASWGLLHYHSLVNESVWCQSVLSDGTKCVGIDVMNFCLQWEEDHDQYCAPAVYNTLYIHVFRQFHVDNAAAVSYIMWLFSQLEDCRYSRPQLLYCITQSAYTFPKMLTMPREGRPGWLEDIPWENGWLEDIPWENGW